MWTWWYWLGVLVFEGAGLGLAALMFGAPWTLRLATVLLSTFYALVWPVTLVVGVADMVIEYRAQRRP